MAVQILWKHIFHTPERPLQTFQTSSSSRNPLQTSCLALTCFFPNLSICACHRAGGWRVQQGVHPQRNSLRSPGGRDLHGWQRPQRRQPQILLEGEHKHQRYTHNSRNTYFLRSRRDPFLWRHAHLKSVTEQEIGFAVFCVCVRESVQGTEMRMWCQRIQIACHAAVPVSPHTLTHTVRQKTLHHYQ